MRLALYQPDIPQNLGAAIRLAACLGAPLEVIEPCGFPLTDRTLKRAALDYGALARVERIASFADFLHRPGRSEGRLVLVETDGDRSLYDFSFATGDTLLVGRESAGCPPEVYAAAQAVVRIPMREGARSLNVAMAAGIALAEALRQTGGLAR
ncbi:MAG TPA: tRNA (cytidine(34)-2'-O)-methyltransferase [Caulobacterales bacterium]|nr:tRNA (cytidine(34)-2'-O)-methyltransferase [Caulobacterales bacterium]